MKIYTRRGDQGQTGLFTGERVAKDEDRLEALGSIDELVSALGVAKAEIADADLRARLMAMQSDLYLLLADIASTAEAGSRVATRLPDDVIAILESLIDRYEGDLPPLRDFVMPGDTRASAALHLARTVCRRAERRVVTIARSYPLAARIPGYLNRLSDLLFVMARWIDFKAGSADRTFKSSI
jgi:cob(I)alamin adenosyltransferase